MGISYEAVTLFGVVFFFAYAFSALTRFQAAPGPMRWAFQGFLFAVLAAYFGYFWSAGRRTLAMKTLGLRLTNGEGYPIGPLRAVARYGLVVLWFVACLGAAQWLHPVAALLLLSLPLGWTLVDYRSRALYDVALGTRLIHDERPQSRLSAPPNSTR